MTHKEAIEAIEKRLELSHFNAAYITREEYEVLRDRIKELEVMTRTIT